MKTTLLIASIIAVIAIVTARKPYDEPLKADIEMIDSGDGAEKYRFTYNNGTVECYYKRPGTTNLLSMDCSGYKK